MSEQAQAATQAASAVPFKLNLKHFVMVPQKFSFKKDELGNKRDTVELQLPKPTYDGILAALEDEKQSQFIIDCVFAETIGQARAQVGDDVKPVNKQEELDISKLTIEAIANLPPSERKGAGISKETWKQFADDYVAIMPALQGKSIENVTNAAKIFVARMQPCKTNKPVLSRLKDYLNLYFTKTGIQEEVQEVYTFLNEKIETFLKLDEATLLQNL